MNKKGSGGEIFAGVLVFILTLFVVLTIISSQEGVNIPVLDFIRSGNVWGGVYNFGASTIEVLKNIAVPEGLDTANHEVIALALFLLVWIIGTKSLKNFLSPVIAFFVGGLVALIAARGLSSIIIEQYVVASPVAASAFMIGILPILMIYGFMNRWSSGKFLVKWMVWMIAAVTYLMVFWFAFNSKTLGIVYLIFMIIAGFVDCFGPLLKHGFKRNKRKELGKFIAMSHDDISTWDTARTAAIQAGNVAGVKATAKAPWEY